MAAMSLQEQQSEEKTLKSLQSGRQGKLVVDVAGLFTLSYNIEEMSTSRQEREKEEQMRKMKVLLKGKNVKVLMPKLDSTLRGRLLRRYKQELGEILRVQRRKLDMPVL